MTHPKDLAGWQFLRNSEQVIALTIFYSFQGLTQAVQSLTEVVSNRLQEINQNVEFYGKQGHGI